MIQRTTRGVSFYRFICAVACLCFWGAAGTSAVFGLSISTFNLATNGTRKVDFSGNTNSYYILYAGASVTNISQPVAMALGAAGTMELQHATPLGAMGYYRILEVPQNQSLDSDGDGMDDVFELTYPDCMNPLDPSDASNDCDGDGRSNLQEFIVGTDPTVPDATPQMVINEIDYDEIGTDSTEFVEILNKGASPVNLSHYSLVFINGANSLEYLRSDLNGTLAGGQYLVVGSSNVVAAAGARTINFAMTDNVIQNGAPDGVTLANVLSKTLMDSFSYEGSITNAQINGFTGTYNLVEGTALSALVQDSNTQEGSLIRSPDGHDIDDAATDWAFTTTPTPGAANVLTP